MTDELCKAMMPVLMNSLQKMQASLAEYQPVIAKAGGADAYGELIDLNARTIAALNDIAQKGETRGRWIDFHDMQDEFHLKMDAFNERLKADIAKLERVQP